MALKLINNYIFTVTAGRSGQATLYYILQKYSQGCLSAFEAPNINTKLPGFLGDLEKRIRRNFIETNELLGRGKILTAFNESQNDYIEKIVQKRLIKINKQSSKIHANTYFDISKFYARGLHMGFNKILDEFSLVFLVRDPLLNMRSYLNRNKNFFLDNSIPEAKNNILRINSKNFSKGEFYLWSWSEILLRYKRMSECRKVKKTLVIKNDDLMYPNKISKILDTLNIQHKTIGKIEKKNTNEEKGLLATKVYKEDVLIFKRFISRIPSKYINDLKYMQESLQIHKKNIEKYQND